jgi:hypothetical protein
MDDSAGVPGARMQICEEPGITSQLRVMVGSTRTGRRADLVIPWIVQRTRDDARFDVDVLDLRDWPLPMPCESTPRSAIRGSRVQRGAVGGARALEHLARIGIEGKLVPPRNNVLIPFVQKAFDVTHVYTVG